MWFWVVLSISVVVLSSVLYETLPPLTDTTDPADPKAPDYHFSRSYLAARHKFLTRAKAAGAELASEVIARDDEIGVDLTMDAAFFKGSRPEKLIVHMSGTHGVEGFAGSAIQAQLLEGLKDGKAAGASVLFVHAVNPFGFHFQRRFNENNVDLNRNWIWSEEEWSKALNRAPNAHGYEDIAWVLNPKVSSWWQYFSRVPSVLTVLPQAESVKRAIVAGQYHNPHGIYYGGSKREMSTLALDRLLKKFTSDSVTKMFVIDVHSGLGPCGEDTLMVDDATEAAEAKSVIKASSGRIEFPDNTPGSPSAGYDAAMGTSKLHLRVPSASGAHVTQEFGTRPGIFVALALAFENSAMRYTHRHSVAQQFGKKLLTSAFFVDTPEWKRRVLERGVAVYDEIRRNV